MIPKMPGPDLIRAGYRFSERSCSNNNLERDDDSKKSHHALAVSGSTESRGQHVQLRRIRAAGSGLHVLDTGKVALEVGKQGRLGAALEHLGEEGAAGLEHLPRERRRRLDQAHDFEVI